LKRTIDADWAASLPRLRDISFAPEEQKGEDGNPRHRRKRPPECFLIVNQGQKFKIHAKETGDQVQWQEDSMF
jgi:hypothetical protein